MKKGTRSSLQSHCVKMESIYVDSGSIRLETEVNGTKVYKDYLPGDTYTILPKTKHRIEVLEDSRLFEVSTPQLDDLTRYEDDFSR